MSSVCSQIVNSLVDVFVETYNPLQIECVSAIVFLLLLMLSIHVLVVLLRDHLIILVFLSIHVVHLLSHLSCMHLLLQVIILLLPFHY